MEIREEGEEDYCLEGETLGIRGFYELPDALRLWPVKLTACLP